MIWYICFALAAAIVAALAFFILPKRRLGVMRLLYAAAGILIMAYILYIPPFFSQYRPIAALLGDFINAMQVISLDADYLAFYDLITDSLGRGVFAQLYFALLAIVHTLLPAIFAMSVITLVVRWLSRLQLSLLSRRRHTLYIFSDINERSKTLARSIRAHGRKDDILFLTSDDAGSFNELRQELYCSILSNTRIEDVRVRSAGRQVHYYCVSPDEEANLNAALAIMASLVKQDSDVQKNSWVYLVSADPTVEMVVDSIDKGFVNLCIVNESRTAAYNLLERHPLYESAEDRRITVLICGASQVALEVLQAAAWCGQLADYQLHLRVVGKHIRDTAADFEGAHPGLFATGRYDIQFYDYANDLEFQSVIREHCSDATYVVVSGGDDDETVDRAVYLRRFFYTNDPQFRKAPPIYAYIENSERAEAVANLRTAEHNPKYRMSYGIVPFGRIREIYSFRNLADSTLDKLSKNVHMVYAALGAGTDDIDVDEALRDYNLFEVDKAGSRANALHIRYKLAMLGLDYTDDPAAVEVDFEKYLTEEKLKKLVVAEHDRWMAFLDSEGWRTATIDQVRAYQGISMKRHKCPLLKMHPFICPFDELKDRSDQLGMQDTTENDVVLIKRIPDILHDKWGAAGMSFKIVERKNTDG